MDPWIVDPLIPDSRLQNSILDSGSHQLDSGFESRGFRIPQTKITWIPDSEFP